MRRWLFNFGYLWVAAWIWPWFVYKYVTTGKYRAGIGQRFGQLAPRLSQSKSIWVHAVSVGELLQIKPLLKALRDRHPEFDIVVTYTTKTAAEIAARELTDYYHCYSPLDLSWVVAKFFRALNPALIVLVELELWPNWLMHAKRKSVPVLLANGRISENSFRNYRRFAWLLQPAYDAISVWAMQDEAYAARAKALAGTRESGIGNGDGAPPGSRFPIPQSRVTVTGNLKYDSLKAEPDSDKVAYFRRAFGIDADQRVLVCGSTHPGEHELLVAMIPRLGCRVVIVPRHPERYAAVREMLTRAGIPWRNRSDLSPENPAGANDVILLDTMGELAAMYGVADVVFIGGSLVPHGGQNMAEPVALGKATLYGPHTRNFKATVRELKECSGALVVQDATELEREVIRLLDDAQARQALGQAGQARLLAGRGALERHMNLVAALLNDR